jgi:hypothetical protein
MQDFKIGAINILTLSISFSSVEQWLKIVLLVASIVYTVLKIFKMKKDETNK